MNKAELVSAVAEKSGLTKKDTAVFVDSLMETVIEAVVSGDKVSLVGFGNFEPRDRAEKNGVNPQTKEPMVIPASKTVGFKYKIKSTWTAGQMSKASSCREGSRVLSAAPEPYHLGLIL
jgi:DNA-binding protein HU-beta